MPSQVTDARSPRVPLPAETGELVKYSVSVVKNLSRRVEDWKGHHLANFGEPLLDDTFRVTKSKIDRQYNVFLFEKVLLCFTEATTTQGASNNLLSLKIPQDVPTYTSQPRPDASETPLELKGRIFMTSVTRAKPLDPRQSELGSDTVYPLCVWWRGDDDMEDVVLQCRSEAQLKEWDSAFQRLIHETAMRRQVDYGRGHVWSHLAASSS